MRFANARKLDRKSGVRWGERGAPVLFPVGLLNREGNCRSLGFAPPDFLWNSVALADLMRPSLREGRTRHLVQCYVAGNPGRDDKGKSRVSSRGRSTARRDRLLGSQVSKARPGAPFDCYGRCEMVSFSLPVTSVPGVFSWIRET